MTDFKLKDGIGIEAVQWNGDPKRVVDLIGYHTNVQCANFEVSCYPHTCPNGKTTMARIQTCNGEGWTLKMGDWIVCLGNHTIVMDDGSFRKMFEVVG